ncbi:MAG: enoyl-CoA hydratase [Polaromonas sp.]|nr:enoyl-CoA hydratase [Polaromonas sp.]
MKNEFEPIHWTGNTQHLQISRAGPVAHIRLCRPAKRNAINDALIGDLHASLLQLPAEIRVLIVSGEGQHFCAGLDLGDVGERDSIEAMAHSRRWHAAFAELQLGRVPVIAVLQGAVVGGGLELASACHLRVAEPSAYFALPEAQRGIFVGGGGSVRIPRLIGVSRMTDMMLTGRVLDAVEAERAGLVNYLVDSGQGFAKALELARCVASNAPLSNFAVTQALPRIADQSSADGLFVESLMAALTERSPEASERLQAFLQKRTAKIQPVSSSIAHATAP